VTRLLARILLAMVCVLVTSWLLVGWGFHVAKKRHLNQDMSQLLELLVEMRTTLGRAEAAELPARLAALGATTKVRFTLLAGAQKAPRELRKRMQQNRLAMRFTRHHGPEIYVPLATSGKVVRVGPVGHLFDRDAYPKIAVLIGMVLSILIAGFALTFPIVRRLRRLERAAERIAAGELSARAAITSKDAIGSLARRFDAMAARIEGLLSSQRELLQGVSHELRTPAARIRFGLEMLADEPEAERRGERLSALEEDLDELDRLVDELLLYVRMGADGSAQIVEREVFAPDEGVASLAQRLGELHPKIVISLPEDKLPELEADPRLFRRALRNLLGNALRYASSRVVVSVKDQGDGWIQVTVDDDGPGIPAEGRERIFDPFTRLDGSRSRASGGVGLGLAIVQRIVQAHGGETTAAESDSGGARLITRWPAASATKRYAAATE
jgi:two-component system sensor histidine kinase RstB